MNQQGISVIICCYNSEKRIKATIQHLGQQQIEDGLLWEVLIINNASTDTTKETAEQAFENWAFIIPFRIIDEHAPGLAAARLRGIKEAKHDLLIFCDDDNHFESSYISKANNLMRTKPDVGILGGWSKPKFTISPGSWIKDFYGALAIGKQAASSNYIRWVFGAGLVIRKKIFQELNDRNIKFQLTDRLGKKQTSGGDTEICLLAQFIGYAVFYSEELALEHAIEKGRLRKMAFLKSSHENFYPIIYLFLLDKIVFNRVVSSTNLLLKLFTQRFSRLFQAMPRCIVGRHQFYNFISLYSNLLFIGWLFLNIKKFNKTFENINLNLAGNE